MLKRNITNNGFVFGIEQDGQSVAFSDWGSTDDRIYYMPLATLVDNGFATIADNACIVPFENIYLLDADERAILGIPPTYPFQMRLRSDGTLNEPSFWYQLELLTHVPDGQLLNYSNPGNVVIIGGRQYLLTKSQYQLMEAVGAFNSKDEDAKTTDNNLIEYSIIKNLAIDAGCELDSYLANEEVYVPEKIKIEVGMDEQGYTIEPSVDIEEKARFQKAFERMRKVQSVYPVQNDKGERMRVVINKAQKSELEMLKKEGGKHRTREQLRQIIEHPTEYFDPDQFDLSEFYSERVIEIGVYKPKFYPFVCPYKSCWITGATVETPQDGTARVEIETEEKLQELHRAIEKAELIGESIVDFNDVQMDIDDARFLSNMAEKQFASPKEPIHVKDKNGKKVLIIEENTEELRYETDRQIETAKSGYTLYGNPFLQDGITLKEHQREGVAWFQYLLTKNASGCLMADDMGLGKTLQVLYLIDWHSRNHPEHKPYLIVAPVSLLENWENEYIRFFKAPRLTVTRLMSRDVPRHFNKEVISAMQDMDIVLTSYETMRNAQINFCAVEFDIVVLDEAQKIKTPGTMVTNAAKALKGNFKIALTGTPVENTLVDLWCIMDFCVPGLLGNAKTFAAQYQSPLKNADTDIVALGNEVHDRLGVYFMRRLKKDVAKDLPKKTERKEAQEMPDIQEQAYINVVNQYISGSQPNMLVTIMGIREISEHPYLYDTTLLDHESDDWIDSSARLQVTMDFMDKIRGRNEKVIVFAERKESQKMLRQLFYERYGIIAKIINGDTPPIVKRGSENRQSRQACIDDFQSKQGFNVIIMSPIAAGMGLNVTAANNVIHYSRHWNPAKENQATDRAYRIGQTKDVYVYYPMAVSKKFKSFDETLDELLGRKTSLATSTIFPTERIEVKQDELCNMLFGKKDDYPAS